MNDKIKLFSVVFIMLSSNIFTQEKEKILINIDKYLFIENYLFIELSIYNKNDATVYLLKEYYFDDIIEIDDNLKISVISKNITSIINIDNEGNEYISSSIHHECKMIDVRSGQFVNLVLLLNIPKNFEQINRNKKIIEICGIKYLNQDYHFVEILCPNFGSLYDNPLSWIFGIQHESEQELNDNDYHE